MDLKEELIKLNFSSLNGNDDMYVTKLLYNSLTSAFSTPDAFFGTSRHYAIIWEEQEVLEVGYVEDLRSLVGNRPLIFVGSAVVLVNSEGRILLQQRKFPKGKWGLPGGLMELGESTEDTARREVYEETGLKVKDLKLINVYSGSKMSTAENGDEFYVVTVAYYSENFEGQLQINQEESIDLQFFDPHELPHYMVGSHRLMLEEFLKKYYADKK